MLANVARLACIAFALISCQADYATAEPRLTDVDQTIDRSRFDALVPKLLEEHRVAGVGIGVLRQGKLVWTAYYGQQAPSKRITSRTVFNAASVAKTITAETMLALAAKGLIDLDEPIAPYCVTSPSQNRPAVSAINPSPTTFPSLGFAELGV